MSSQDLKLTISIGGMSVAIISNSNTKFYLDDIYAKFIDNTITSPDVLLRILENSMPHEASGTKIFDSCEFFSIYRNGEEFIIYFHIQDIANTYPYKMMILNPQIQSAFLYIDSIDHMECSYLPPLRILISFLLSKGRGIMLHACGISDNGRGIIFTGPSGSGKSTLANLWKDKDGVKILNDELVIIRKIEEHFWIYGTPWHGTPWPGNSQLYSPEWCPLKNIFFIEPVEEIADENVVVCKKDIEAVTAMLPQSFPQIWDTSSVQFNIDFLDELIRKIPCYKLCFMPKDNVVDFVRTIIKK